MAEAEGSRTKYWFGDDTPLVEAFIRVIRAKYGDYYNIHDWRELLGGN